VVGNLPGTDTYDAHVLLSMEEGDTFLPTGMPVSVSELLSSYVELAVPATRTQPEYLADAGRGRDPDHVRRRTTRPLAGSRTSIQPSWLGSVAP
jgi:cytochrome P450/NADPH-cytochrome P450 reductase